MTRRRILIGAGWALAVGVLLTFGYRSWRTYRITAMSSEATVNVRTLADAAITWYRGGCEPGIHPDCDTPPVRPPPHRFPPSAGPVPADGPLCSDGEPVFTRVDPAVWQHPTWAGLKFAPTEPIHFRYEVISAGTGAESTFTVRAIGDLNCDGIRSTYERHLGRDVDMEDEVVRLNLDHPPRAIP